MLSNILIHEGISSNAADEAAKVFTRTLKEAGLLVNDIIVDVGGVLEAMGRRQEQEIVKEKVKENRSE